MKIKSLNEVTREMSLDNIEEKLFLENATIDRTIFKDENSDIILFEKIVPKGKMISIRKHTRYIHYPIHSHNYIELNYVLQGTCVQEIEKKKIELYQGDLLFLSPSMKHEIYPASKQDIILNFIINIEFFNYIFEFIGHETSLSNFLIDAVFKNFSPKALKFKTKSNQNIQEFINKIILELNNDDDDFRETRIKFLLGLIIVELMRETPEEISNTSYETKIFYKTIMYMESDLKDVNLNDISKKLNLKNYNLSKLIKKEAGQTFNDILKDIRLKKICELLKSSNLPISELAFNVGFSNSSYFYKLFKEKYNMSPKEFRQKMTLNSAK